MRLHHGFRHFENPYRFQMMVFIARFAMLQTLNSQGYVRPVPSVRVHC